LKQNARDAKAGGGPSQCSCGGKRGDCHPRGAADPSRMQGGIATELTVGEAHEVGTTKKNGKDLIEAQFVAAP